MVVAMRWMAGLGKEVSVRAMPLNQPLNHLGIELSSQAPAPRSTRHQRRGCSPYNKHSTGDWSGNKSLMSLLPPYLYYPIIFLPLTFFTSPNSLIRYLSYSSFPCLTLFFSTYWSGGGVDRGCPCSGTGWASVGWWWAIVFFCITFFFLEFGFSPLL